ncbi:MAG: hypothetical protein ACYC48_03115 [Minisyncoccota bacterium]
MKENVTSYFITIGIVLTAIGAAWLIMRIANANTAATVTGTEANYSALQQSILK